MNARSHIAALLPLVAALALPGTALGAGELFTVAGDSGALPVVKDRASGSEDARGAAIATLPDGGFLIAEGNRVRKVDAKGRTTIVAGTGTRGSTGDGGPAVEARIAPNEVEPMSDGGFLIAQSGGELYQDTVRRVYPDGTIATVAGRPDFGSRKQEGIPATDAQVSPIQDIAVRPDGAYLVADGETVRLVTPDGRIVTVAGRGYAPEDDKRLRLGGAAVEADITPSAVAWLPDGGFLIAETYGVYAGGGGGSVLRVSPGGTITRVAGRSDDTVPYRPGALATTVSISPTSIAATPDGGFVFGELGAAPSEYGVQPAVRKVRPDGRIFTVAGTARTVYGGGLERGDERREGGRPATKVDLLAISDVAATADGGVLISEGTWVSPGDRTLIRYVTPAAPKLLAAGLPPGPEFSPRRRHTVHVLLTKPAHVGITVVRGGRSVMSMDAMLPAGSSQVTLPRRLARTPYVLLLDARDEQGARAGARLDIFPAGWLRLKHAEIYAYGLIASLYDTFRVKAYASLVGCRRLGAARVDCAVRRALTGPCGAIVRLTLQRGKIWWSAYRCPYRARPRYGRRPSRVREHRLLCGDFQKNCAPAPPASASSRTRSPMWTLDPLATPALSEPPP